MSGSSLCSIPQHAFRRSVVFSGVSKAIGNDQGANDRRQEFRCLVGREAAADELVQAHLEEAAHFFRNGLRQSCDEAPSTVQGHICGSENAVPRKAFVQTRTGSGFS